MCRDLNVPVEIRTCETVREADGLALSSRNTYLSTDQRQRAVRISEALRLAIERVSAGADDLADVRREMREYLAVDPAFEIEYLTIVDGETLEELNSPSPRMVAIAAARLGTTRLIDNLLIPLKIDLNKIITDNIFDRYAYANKPLPDPLYLEYMQFMQLAFYETLNDYWFYMDVDAVRLFDLEKREE